MRQYSTGTRRLRHHKQKGWHAPQWNRGAKRRGAFGDPRKAKAHANYYRR